MAPQDGSAPLPEGRASCLPTCVAPSYSSANECTSQTTKEMISGPAVSELHTSADDDDAWSDHDDGAWLPARVHSSELDGSAEDWDDDSDGWNPAAYCTNCTAPMFTTSCHDCGHSGSHDATLLNCEQRSRSTGTVQQPKQRPAPPVLIWDEHMLLHDEGKPTPHPERPDRLRAVMAQLTRSGLTDACVRVPSRPATEEELLAVHTRQHLQHLTAHGAGEDTGRRLPPDTYFNEHTLSCASLAAGSAAEAAVQVAKGAASCAAAIIRPPGHHAESNTAMGFCFFNNAAVAARAAQRAGAGRILIVDWDVHHGNGTQHIFESDPSVMYMSLHRYDRGCFYPGTGAAEEVGHGPGAGATVNIPWDSAGIGDGDYLAAFQAVVLPIARAFRPHLILISAGFDAAKGDPIGGCEVTPACFGHLTGQLASVAPCVLLLEGGYNLRSTAVSTEACLRVLLGEAPQPLPAASQQLSAWGWLGISSARRALKAHWPVLLEQELAPPPAVLARRSALKQQHQQQGHCNACSVGPSSSTAAPASAAVSAGLRGDCEAQAANGSRSSHPRSQLKLRLLQGIHKRAVRLFWKRRRVALANRGAHGSK